jgi:tetratricopeptide (TPR) repeat protein
MRREFGWPLTELGMIRLRRGDLAGAGEAFVAAHANGWDPQPGLALLRLAEGDVATARALIRDALERPADLPSKERPPRSELCRAPLLDAEVEIAVAADDLAAARRAADELERTAAVFRSRALDASAALARGRVTLAEGDAAAAAAACEEAVRAWCEVGAPYETAVARSVLAAAARRDGNDERAELEVAAARAGLHGIGGWHRDLAGSTAIAASPPVAGSVAPAGMGASVFRLDGNTRTVAFAGVEVLLRDLKGMRLLARLLAEPGREFHVLDLAGAGAVAADGTSPPAGATDDLSIVEDGDLGPALDDQARDAYRRRLAEVEQDIDDATRAGDTQRAALAAADRDYLVAELAGAFGLGGRRRAVGSSSERARASVTRAIRYTLARIGQHHRPLAEHWRRRSIPGRTAATSPIRASPSPGSSEPRSDGPLAVRVWGIRPVATPAGRSGERGQRWEGSVVMAVSQDPGALTRGAAARRMAGSPRVEDRASAALGWVNLASAGRGRDVDSPSPTGREASRAGRRRRRPAATRPQPERDHRATRRRCVGPGRLARRPRAVAEQPTVDRPRHAGELRAPPE